MNTYLTTYPTPSLGRWLAMLAVGLILLAIAYAQAPDPAGLLGLALPDGHVLASSHPTQHSQR